MASAGQTTFVQTTCCLPYTRGMFTAPVRSLSVPESEREATGEKYLSFLSDFLPPCVLSLLSFLFFFLSLSCFSFLFFFSILPMCRRGRARQGFSPSQPQTMDSLSQRISRHQKEVNYKNEKKKGLKRSQC